MMPSQPSTILRGIPQLKSTSGRTPRGRHLGLRTTVQTTHDPSPSRTGFTKIGHYRGRRRQLPHPNGIIGQAARHRCYKLTPDGPQKNPRGKRTTTEQEDIFFHRSLRTPKPTTGVTSNANTVRTSIAKTSKIQRKHKNPKHISAIVVTGAQVTTMPESAVSKMPNAHNHRDAPPGTAERRARNHRAPSRHRTLRSPSHPG